MVFTAKGHRQARNKKKVEEEEDQYDEEDGKFLETAPEHDEELLQEGEEDDEEEEEPEEITRCICGNQEPPDESGLYIQCEKCSVWQHGHCVSIFDDALVPDKYWCEKCKPDLHQFVIRPDGKRTKYLPAQPKENKRKGKRTVSASQLNTEESAKHEVNEKEPPKKKRGLQRTREEIRYDAWVKRAIEESKKDAEKQETDTPKRVGGRRSRRTEEEEEEEEENEDVDNESQYDKKSEEDDEQEESFNVDSKNKVSSLKEKSESLKDPVEAEKDFNSDISADKSTSRTKDEGLQSESKNTAGINKKDYSSESNNDSVDTSVTNKPKRGTKRGNNKKPTSSSSNTSVPTSSSRKSPQKEEEIDFSKPTKPRLPQQRSTVNDMRKRVSAILEFIGRTQVELANENSKENDEFTKFVEDEESKLKINQLFEKSNESLKLMDSLTGKLLVWEEKFGKYGS